MKELPDCARCKVPVDKRICLHPDGIGPKNCPTLNFATEYKTEFQQALETSKEFAKLASLQEAACYQNRFNDKSLHATKPRLIETVEFAKRIGAKRLGVAFCVGLTREAEIVANFLASKGFEICSVMCKAGSVPKETLGLTDNDKLRPGTHEPMCHPIAQAKIFNAVKTDLNILLGLCVGHDSLFFKFSEAPVTVLAAKDRTTGHNPLAAVYALNSYFRWLKD